jgi:thioesterase domain-containing protein
MAVFLLRGRYGVFSTGLDRIRAKLASAGVPAEISHWGNIQRACNAIMADRHGPSVLIGHSLGANASVTIACRLKAAGIPLDLLVTFDPVGTVPLHPVPSNVRQALNFFQPWPTPYVGHPLAAESPRTALVNNRRINTHLTIEKTPSDQNAVVTAVLALRCCSN